MKGTMWKAVRHDEYVWVAFVFLVDDDKVARKEVHYLEYVPNGVVPTKNSCRIDIFQGLWERISPETAKQLIPNMTEQDNEYAFRMARKEETQSLAEALKILENKSVAYVSMGDNYVRISTENGAEYEISISKHGYKSRQIGLPDV